MSVTVFTGCQACGKTNRMIEAATQHSDVLDEEGILMIHHPSDTRDEKNVISSNSSSYLGLSPKFVVSTSDSLKFVDEIAVQFNLICIDEIQLFDDLAEYCRKWRDEGKHVFCAGLNLDWRGNDYGHVKDLMSVQTSYHVLTAKCVHCLHEIKDRGLVNVHEIPTACRTGKIGGTDDVTEIGGKERYVPLCFRHHQLLLEQRNK